MIGMAVGTFFGFLMGLLQPAAGPDWLWAGGRADPIRRLYFRPDGSFRRYGRLALLSTLALGSVALYWMLSQA